MVELTVRTMTEAEFQRWRRALAEEFAAEQVAAGNWAAEEALDLSLEGNEAMLPHGLATAGMLLLNGVRADGLSVGVLWIGLTHPRGVPDAAFLYDIEIAEEHRGAGYGRALLAAAEDAVRACGVGRLELNVFGDNDRAIRLYQAAGYDVVTQQMRKLLSP